MTDNLLMKVRIARNTELSDDKIVEECMNNLMEKYPQVAGYQYERPDADHILILMWFSEPVDDTL